MALRILQVAIVGVVVLVWLVVLFGGAFVEWWRRDWETATGEVFDEPEIREGRNPETGRYWWAEWPYRFVANGVSYHGVLKIEGESMEHVHEFIAAVRQGAPVQVQYDPKNPSRSSAKVDERELLRVTPR